MQRTGLSKKGRLAALLAALVAALLPIVMTAPAAGAATLVGFFGQTQVAGNHIVDFAYVNHFVTDPDATGTVTFSLWSNANCSHPVFMSTNPVTDGYIAASDIYTATEPGTYYWTAVYSGDANYPPAFTACGAQGQTAVVTDPVLSTQASPASVSGGHSFSDAATLSGGYRLSGTIHFDVFGPHDPGCTGSPIVSFDVPVQTSGVSSSPPVFASDGPGTYRFQASYSGDEYNNPVGSACDDPAEQVVVSKANVILHTTATPSVGLGASLGDTATLENAWGPTGTVTFNAYGPNPTSCSGPPVFSSTRTINATGDYTSAPFTPALPGTYLWVASFNGDNQNNPAAGMCGDSTETSTVTCPSVPANGIVASGTVACASGGTINGSITVQPGATLVLNGTRVTGSLSSNGASRIIVCGSSFGGGVTVSNSTGLVRFGNPSAGCAGNSTTGTVAFNSNKGGVEVGGNTIGGGLNCAGNTPAPSGSANTTKGSKTGQCTTV
jgi:hypothetical protein